MEARLLLGAIWMATMLGLQVSVKAADDNSLPYSFITTEQKTQAHEGEDVLFKCELEGSPHMVMWMNDTTPITFGRSFTFPNPRLTIEGEGHAYNLRIKEVTLMDEGEWICQVPGQNTIEQTNTLTIVIDPSITATPEEGSLDVMEAEAVKLSCEADGKPDPNVTWSKEGDAHFKEEGVELSFGAIRRDNSGTYICTATNGIGEAATETFEVEVMFAPTVEVLEETVHTGPNDQVSLTCDFTSFPPVNIVWQHNGQDLNLEEGGNFRATETDSDDDDFEVTSTLTILEMQATDLGEYTCIGGNGKGEDAKGTINVSGEPYQLEVISSVDGDYSDVFILEWEFFSVADPTECLLQVTQNGEQFGENVVPSRVGDNSRHQQVYRISGLTKNTQYGAKLNCKNTFGETGFSEEFQFNTSEEENPAPLPTTTLEPEPELETTLGPKPTTQKLPVETTEETKETTTTLAEEDVTTGLAVVAIDTDDDDKENDQDKDDDNDDDDDKEDDDDNDDEDFEEIDNGSDNKPPEAQDVVGAASDVKAWSLLTLTFLVFSLVLRQ